jgi:transcription elongation GreA/GreB family factor
VSKAFTDEEALTASVPGRLVQRAARGDERPVTARGYRELSEQAEALKRALVASPRPDDAARAQLEHRLALLHATLESVRVVEPLGEPGVVRFGSSVELRWGDGRAQALELVGPDETDGKGRISVDSPLGRALLGQREGAEVEIERPRGVASATIAKVR